MTEKTDQKLPAEIVSRRICELGGWKVSNLELQKLLYLAHMYYSGWSPSGLVDGEFQAWKFGPVMPQIYHRVSYYGNEPIDKTETWTDNGSLHNVVPSGEADQYLKGVCRVLGRLSPSRLVAYTHDELGAWRAVYQEGVRGIRIPQEEIVKEFERRAEWLREQELQEG